MSRDNADENCVLQIANSIPGVLARLAYSEEDCGYKKADVVLNYNSGIYYIQVSYTPKSKKQQAILLKRGTFFISTHKFENMPLPVEIIRENLEKILNEN